MDDGEVDLHFGSANWHGWAREPAPTVGRRFADAGTARTAGASGVLPAPGLDAGFFVCRNHELIVFQSISFPCAGIQVEDPASFVGEMGIAWEDPATVVPGSNRILIEPPPKRIDADRSDQARLTDLSRQIRSTPTRQWQVVRRREFAGPSLDLQHQFRGKKSGGDPDVNALPSPQDAP